MNWNGLELPQSYYQDDAVYIIHADCRDILPLLPDKSIDLVLTDPPYQVSNGADDIMDFSIFKPIIRLMKDGTGIFCFCGQATLDLFMTQFRELEMTWLNTIIWHYSNTIPREKHRFAISYDPVLFYSKGTLTYFNCDAVRVDYKSTERLKSAVYKNGKAWDPNPLGALRKDVWNIPAITSPAYTDEKVDHKWQKPIETVEPMIQATTQKNEFILDPFLGSGTTAYCAKKLGRRCIGIEIEEKYCEIAAKRCSQSVMRLEV